MGRSAILTLIDALIWPIQSQDTFSSNVLNIIWFEWTSIPSCLTFFFVCKAWSSFKIYPPHYLLIYPCIGYGYEIEVGFSNVIRIYSNLLITEFQWLSFFSYVSYVFVYFYKRFVFFIMDYKVDNECMYLCCIDSEWFTHEGCIVYVFTKKVLVLCYIW